MFAKIFTQIFDSSIVEHPDVRFTLMDLLVLCDCNGVVDMTHEAIARRTNRPLETIRSTIAELEQPDARSRTPDAGGARLKRLDAHRDWGWLIVNYDRFRQTASEEQRRSKTNARVQKHRKEMQAGIECNAPVTPCNAPVTHRNAPKRMKRHAEAEAEGEEKGKTSEPTASDSFAKVFRDRWCAAYQTDLGRKYLFAGGKDGSAVKRLAGFGLSVDYLMGIAQSAWSKSGPKFWHCEKAVTVAYFASAMNEIQTELGGQCAPAATASFPGEFDTPEEWAARVKRNLEESTK